MVIVVILILIIITTTTTTTGNPKASWKKLEFDEDLKVDYEEFARMNKSFPWLFLPAFRLQNNMMIRTFGELWWSNRKRRIQNFKDKIEEAYQKKQKKKEKKKKYAGMYSVVCVCVGVGVGILIFYYYYYYHYYHYYYHHHN